MTPETIFTLIAGLLGGAVGGKLVDLWRYRNKDKADALTVSTQLLTQWIKDASTAQQKIGELIRENGSISAELKEALHSVNLCKKSLERCRERHGCGE